MAEPKFYELQVPLDRAAQEVLGFAVAVGPQDRVKLAAMGNWNVLPFGVSMGTYYGLRVLPGHPLEESPVAICNGGVCATVCSGLRYAIPTLLFRKLARLPAAWSETREKWPSVKEQLLAAHKAWGGDDLDAIEAYIADKHLEELAHRHQGTPKTTRAQIDALRTLDADPRHNAFWDWATQAMQSYQMYDLGGISSLPPAPPADLGPWQELADALAFSAGYLFVDWLGAIDAPEEMVRRTFRFLCNPATIDTSLDFEAKQLSVWIRPHPLATQTALETAADLLARELDMLPEPLHRDPRLAPSAHIATQPEGPHGTELMQAAYLLSERGDHLGAWNTLATASFWLTVSTGDAVEVVSLARTVAKDGGFHEVEELLSELGDFAS